MNICVVGTGYVGLVTGAVFADLGNDVVCVDNDQKKIEALRAGKMPIYEPGLEEMVSRNTGDGRLSFTTDLPSGVKQSDVIFIAVGTPPKDTGETDLSHVEAVAAEIGRAMDRYKVVVNKSTSPVGTGEFVREVISRHQTVPHAFDVVSNPEANPVKLRLDIRATRERRGLNEGVGLGGMAINTERERCVRRLPVELIMNHSPVDGR